MVASSHGRGGFSAGPSSPASSSPVDSDNDTDLDSTEAEIAAQAFHLPLPGQQLLQEFPRQYVYPERYSSRPPRSTSTYGNVRPQPSQEYQLSREEKQYFDHFWTDFHKKRQQRRAQAPDTYIDTERSVADIMAGRFYQGKPYNARTYGSPRHPQPLVNLVRNSWQTDSRFNAHPGWSNEDPDPTSPTLIQVLSAPRPRRWLLILLTSVIFLFVYWEWHGAEAWDEQKLLSKTVGERMRSKTGYFGANMLPQFPGMIHVKKLDLGLVPQPGDNKRLIVVGDVHGCVDELQKLLTKLDFNPSSDHLILAGDLVSNGPSSPATVDLAIASRASCIRGNREDRVLLAYRDLQNHHALPPHPIDSSKKQGTAHPPGSGNPNKATEAEAETIAEKTTESASFLSGDHVDQIMAKSLSKEQIEYLSSCPVILDVGPIAGFGDVRIVHAGLVPGVSLPRQDPASVMQMRTLDLETHVPSHVNDGILWTKVWNKYQSFLPKRDRSTVIYGHDSIRGLQLGKYTKGIDTGCVKGGKLTAMILTSDKNRSTKTVSVDCRDYLSQRAPSGEELGQS